MISIISLCRSAIYSTRYMQNEELIYKGTDCTFVKISIVKIKIRFLGRAVCIRVSRVENLSLLIAFVTHSLFRRRARLLQIHKPYVIWFLECSQTYLAIILAINARYHHQCRHYTLVSKHFNRSYLAHCFTRAI